ncbi:MAG TPA: cytochrome c biogenesis protein CcdA [Gemmatimonadaceae bacterium]|nr:cytochrome c biogenesis protein CcdA [Gemmatimonadaceae bacterium]
MEGVSLGVAISFTAGLLSFLSPCVLPLIPSYVTFVTGLSLEDVQHARRTALVHALLFVLGFSLIFLALGATATVLGRLLLVHRVWITRLGGALVILFGLYLLGAFNMGWLARERRVQITDKPLGYLGTVLVGSAFGAGWSPCIGPILGGILTYTATQADLGRGLVLLAAYSLGLALPFVLAAVAIDRFMSVFHRFRSRMIWVDRLAGALLIVVGVLMITNYLAVLSGTLQTLTPDALRNRL